MALQADKSRDRGPRLAGARGRRDDPWPGSSARSELDRPGIVASYHSLHVGSRSWPRLHGRLGGSRSMAVDHGLDVRSGSRPRGRFRLEVLGDGSGGGMGSPCHASLNGLLDVRSPGLGRISRWIQSFLDHRQTPWRSSQPSAGPGNPAEGYPRRVSRDFVLASMPQGGSTYAAFLIPFFSAIQRSICSPSTSSGRAPAPRIWSWNSRMSNLVPSSFFAFSRSSRILSWPIL